MMEKVAFPAQVEVLEEIMQWVLAQIALMSFSEADTRKIQLAMEEALVNVMVHAYKDGKGIVEVICNIYPNERITFTIMDKGPSFNPLLQTPKVPVDTPLEEREEGGLGILFIREFMDEVHYQRHQQYNVLTLIKVWTN